MTVLERLAQWAGVAPTRLVAIIRAGMAADPDHATDGQKILDAMNSALSAESLARLAVVILSEGKDIAGGKIDPRRHPSSAG